MLMGILLLLLGFLMLLQRLGLIHGDFWSFVWPTVLVAIGITMITKHRKKNELF